MSTKVVSRGKVELKDKYVGETKRQLRHGEANTFSPITQLRHYFLPSGYGVYKYDNKFFRYEGQWENGLKHGTTEQLLATSLAIK